MSGEDVGGLEDGRNVLHAVERNGDRQAGTSTGEELEDAGPCSFLGELQAGQHSR
jgi:hypothetical protein